MKNVISALIVSSAAIVFALKTAGQTEPPISNPLGSLKTVAIPEPGNLADFIADKPTAIALGKALFWEMSVGSDGIQSCATCHFHAGTDSRSKNELNPGKDGVFAKGVNYQLSPADFPFHKLQNPDDRNSTVLSDIDDVTGSHGVFDTKFNKVVPGSPKDDVTVVPDPVFNVKNGSCVPDRVQCNSDVRRVTGRNAPNVINAVFNFRNFWDGRAQNRFNGVNPFGLRDPNAKVLRATSRTATVPVSITLENAALASQAVGPPLSAVEESADCRVFPNIGKKLRALTPLGRQLVAYDDSVLGPYAYSTSSTVLTGLKVSYEALIKKAFKPEWWNSTVLANVGDNCTVPVTYTGSNPPGSADAILQPASLAPNQFTQMDYNFSLFMGLSVQLYEATLVSDDAPLDRYFDGTGTLTPAQLAGKALFEGKVAAKCMTCQVARCINCHGGPELTNASVRNVENQRLEHMRMADGVLAVYDNGFYNIGVRPTADDLGLGKNDPFGNPLSESRLAQLKLFELLLGAQPNIPVALGDRIVRDGAFKVPSLRNVALTAPYFHNGGKATLSQVVDFYNHGGDFHDQNIANLDPDIQNLGLTSTDKANLVEFLRTLTDDRVRFEKAPFDHPQLRVPRGHPGDTTHVTDDGTGQATDSLMEIPAVGRNGGAGTPNFLNIEQ
jgi:cytochrome c peroxidase